MKNFIVNRHNTNYTYIRGWFGTYDDSKPCESFSLEQLKEYVYSATIISKNGTSRTQWIWSTPSFAQSFTKLECGNLYEIVLKPGDPSVDISIPGFTINNQGGTSNGLINKDQTGGTPDVKQIQLNPNNYTYVTGWYGMCGGECDTYDLRDLGEDLYLASQINSKSTSRVQYIHGVPIQVQTFHTMECGFPYELIFNPGEGLIEIPNFNWNRLGSPSAGILSDDCIELSTPKPLEELDLILEPTEIKHNSFELLLSVSNKNSDNTEVIVDSYDVERPNTDLVTHPASSVGKTKIVFSNETPNTSVQLTVTAKKEGFVSSTKSVTITTLNEPTPTPTQTPIASTPTPTPTPEATPTPIILILEEALKKGERILPIVEEEASKFKIGTKILIDEGSSSQEYNQILSVDPIVLKFPLEYDHNVNSVLQIIDDSEYLEPTPTPTPTEVQSTPTPVSGINCCPSNFTSFDTTGSINLVEKKQNIDGVEKTLFSFTGFSDGGKLCIDLSLTDGYQLSESTPSVVYVYFPVDLETSVASVYKFLTNESNKFYYEINGICWEGEFGTSNKIVLTELGEAIDPTPTPVRFRPSSTDELRLAVTAYSENREETTEQYGDINTWDVSEITDLYRVFYLNKKFNFDISAWDVSNVTRFTEAFSGAELFNKNINDWDVSSGTDFDGMFSGAYDFNKPLNKWNVSNAIKFNNFFSNALNFNQDISSWNTKNVTNMSGMFNKAINFDQNLENWDISSVSDMKNIFMSVSLSIENYSSLLIGWAKLNETETKIPNDIELLSTDSKYNKSAEISRNKLVNLHKWKIDDGGCVDCAFFPNTKQDLQSAIQLFIENPTEAKEKYGNPNEWTVSNVTDMSFLFLGKDFNEDISDWDVSNVTNMSNMFAVSSFNQPIGDWDVSNVKNMSGMFSSNSTFEQDIRSWDVSSVTDMSSMFSNTKLFTLSINNWKLDSVTTMSDMFKSTKIPAVVYEELLGSWVQQAESGTNFPQDISLSAGLSQYTEEALVSINKLKNDFGWEITDSGQSAFVPRNYDELKSAVDAYIQDEVATKLTHGDINDWDIHAVTSLENLFNSKSDFNSDISNWDTSNVTNMNNLFKGASSFNKPINNWDTSSVTTMSSLFENASAFNQPLDKWKTDNVKQMDRMFTKGIFNQNISNWNTKNLIDTTHMFSESKFNQSLNNWNVENLKLASHMFYMSEFNQPLNDWKTTSLTTMAGMFSNSPFNQSLNTWDISNVTLLNDCFSNNTTFNHSLKNWDVSNVESMKHMFKGATSFNGEISTWNVAKCKNFNSMFQDASSFNQDVSVWDISGVPYGYITYSGTRISNLNYFLDNATAFSTENYDKLLNKWSVVETNEIKIPKNIIFYNRGLTHSELGKSAKDKLKKEYGWEIGDAGCTNCAVETRIGSIKIPNYSITGELSSWKIGGWKDSVSVLNLFGELTIPHTTIQVFTYEGKGVELGGKLRLSSQTVEIGTTLEYNSEKFIDLSISSDYDNLSNSGLWIYVDYHSDSKSSQVIRLDETDKKTIREIIDVDEIKTPTPTPSPDAEVVTHTAKGGWLEVSWAGCGKDNFEGKVFTVFKTQKHQLVANFWTSLPAVDSDENCLGYDVTTQNFSVAEKQMRNKKFFGKKFTKGTATDGGYIVKMYKETGEYVRDAIVWGYGWTNNADDKDNIELYVKPSLHIPTATRLQTYLVQSWVKTAYMIPQNMPTPTPSPTPTPTATPVITSYQLLASKSNVIEGDSVSISLKTINVAKGTKVFATCTHPTECGLSGLGVEFQIDENGVDSFTISPKLSNDKLTERITFILTSSTSSQLGDSNWNGKSVSFVLEKASTPTPTPKTTNLTQPAQKGDTILQIPQSDQQNFKTNDDIVIDKNTEIEEYNKIVGFGSLKLARALKYDHGLNAMIEVAEDAPDQTPTPYPAPADFKITSATDQSLTVEWSLVSANQDKVELQISDKEDFSLILETSEVFEQDETNQETFAGLVHSKKYYIRISAFIGSDNASVYATTSGFTTIPGNNLVVSKTIDNDLPKLDWGEYNGEYKYVNVFRHNSESSSFEKIISVNKSDATFFVDTSATTDGVYIYKLSVDNGFAGSFTPTFEIKIDTTPPEVPTITTESNLTNNKTPTWNWNSVESNVAYEITLDGNVVTIIKTTSYKPSSNLNDGEHILEVSAIDSFGNKSEKGISKVVVDTTPPTLPNISSPSSPTNNKRPAWTWNENADVSKYGVVFSGDAETFTTNTSFIPSQDLNDGSYILQIRAYDEAGNVSDYVASLVVVDTSAPSLTEISVDSPTNNNKPTWTWTSVTGAVEYGVVLNSNVEITQTQLTFTSPISLSDGEHTLKVRSRDGVGNWSDYVSSVVKIDTTPPTKPVIIASSPTSNKRPTLVASTPDSGGPFHYEFRLNDGPVISSESVTYIPSVDLVDGNYTFYARVKDTLNNWSEWSSKEFIVDLTPPSVPVISVQSPTSNNQPTWTWDAVDGAVGYGIILNNSAETLQPGAIRTYTPQDKLSDGEHTLKVRSQDSVGNMSEYATSKIVVDTTAPLKPVVTSETAQTANNKPTWNWDGISDATLYKWKLITTDSSGTELNSSEGSTSLTFYTPSIPLNDGYYRLEVSAVDALGNESVKSSFTIQIDSTPPNIPTVSVVDETRNRKPTWNFVSNSSDVSEYEYKLLDLNNQIVTQSNTNSTSFTPSEDLQEGTFTLEVRAIDSFGNKSDWGSKTSLIFCMPDTTTIVSMPSTIEFMYEDLSTFTATYIGVQPSDKFGYISSDFQSTLDGGFMDFNIPSQTTPITVIFSGNAPKVGSCIYFQRNSVCYWGKVQTDSQNQKFVNFSTNFSGECG